MNDCWVVETDLMGPAKPIFSASVNFFPAPNKGIVRRSHTIRVTHLFIGTPPQFAFGFLEAKSASRVCRFLAGEAIPGGDAGITVPADSLTTTNRTHCLATKAKWMNANMTAYLPSTWSGAARYGEPSWHTTAKLTL